MKPKLILPLSASLRQAGGDTFTVQWFFENDGAIDANLVTENR